MPDNVGMEIGVISLYSTLQKNLSKGKPHASNVVDSTVPREHITKRRKTFPEMSLCVWELAALILVHAERP